MPIIEDSAPLIYPKTDYTIVKYMDLTKFLSLLQRKEMFFCRQDKLEDGFEGQTAKRNYEWRLKSLQSLNESNFFASIPMLLRDKRICLAIDISKAKHLCNQK